MNVNEFGSIFLKLRKELGKTQGEMASILKVSKSTIGMWETGRRLPSPELYEQIADYFNIDIDYLYGRSSIRQMVHYDSDGTAYIPVSSAAGSLLPDEVDLLRVYRMLEQPNQEKLSRYAYVLLDAQKVDIVLKKVAETAEREKGIG